LSKSNSQQIEFLKSAQKIKVSKDGFDVMGIDGLFAMKSIVIHDHEQTNQIHKTHEKSLAHSSYQRFLLQ